MTDRRRVNGPPGGTHPPVFAVRTPISRPIRTRKPNELRKIFLQTSLIPSAAGSAYLELETPSPSSPTTFLSKTPTIKLSCSINGPKPLPRNANFSSNLQLSASVKFAPFATSQRRGYVRDSTERDLGIHLENVLKGVILADRWPKSSLDVGILVLEGEDATQTQDNDNRSGVTQLAHMNILAACITVAIAALADAKIDCLDLAVGGVAACVVDKAGLASRVLDPCPVEHETVSSACVVGYLPSRDEIVDVWSQGAVRSNTGDGLTQSEFDLLLDSAIGAARGVQGILKEVLVEAASRDMTITTSKDAVQEQTNPIEDVQMKL